MKNGKIQYCMELVNKHRIITVAVAIFALIGGWIFIQPQTSEASAPGSGALNAAVGTSVTWAGDRALPLPPAANGEPSCSTGDATATNCDVFTLTVNPGNWAGKKISVQFNWALVANDYDMTVRQETNGVAGMQGDGLTGVAPTLDAVLGTSGNGTNTFEEVIISPPDTGGVYHIRSIYFAGGGPSDQYQGSATVQSASNQAPPSACAVPTFDNYQPPVGFPRRDNSGEPSVGVNWNTGAVMTMSRLQANRTTFDDSTSPANPTTTSWFPRTSPTIVTGLDPILFTDSVTGRTIAGELNGAAGATNGFISDDDLSTILASFQTGGGTQGVDHQTIGGGPPKAGVVGRQPTGAYPHLTYYASQSIATATVATSFDGGVTYQPAVPAYTLAECGGLHGHIKVAPNGTAYLPNKGCGGKSGFARSQDNGLTWEVKTAPDSTSGNTDPSVGIGAGGRVYFAYAGGDNRPHVAISNDEGETWVSDFDLSLSVTPNLKATVFMHAVAGDNDRAQIFFLATDSTAPGDPVGDDATTAYAGTWYPYVAYTCDGGASWSVTKADNDPLNPGIPNPVQQGVVCTNGTTCPDGTRNLLDFNEATLDSRGRLIAVYADGCNFGHPCSNITDNSGTKTENQGEDRLTIIRQRGGFRLFSAFDPGGPAAPTLSPPVEVKEESKGYSLKWATPDDNGSPLISYRIYRSVAGGSEEIIAEVKASQNQFKDKWFGNPSRRNVSYRVTATNRFGESPRNVSFSAADENRTKEFVKNSGSEKRKGE